MNKETVEINGKTFEVIGSWEKVVFDPIGQRYYWTDDEPELIIWENWDGYDRSQLPDYLICCEAKSITWTDDIENSIVEFLDNNHRGQDGEYPEEFLQHREKLTALCEQFSKDVNAYLSENCRFYDFEKTDRVICMTEDWIRFNNGG